MFQVQKRVYGNLNCWHTAMMKFYALRIWDEEFHDFWLGFQRLSTELDYNKVTPISGLTFKLIPALQIQLALANKALTKLYAYADRC